MDRLWPAETPPSVADLEEFYDYPSTIDRAWVRVNFVSSLDGASAVQGSSRGLSGPEDVRVLVLIRDLSDVVLVGAGTAVAENYRGIRDTETRQMRRRRHGLAEVPPVAVVTRTAGLPLDSPVLTDTSTPPIVITCRAAREARRTALAEAGADVILAGEEDVDLSTAVRELAERGLRRIVCEGGPQLFGSLVAEDLVDELCLTVSPLLAAGSGDRIAHGALPSSPRSMRLRSVLRTEDSLLLLRYARTAE